MRGAGSFKWAGGQELAEGPTESNERGGSFKWAGGHGVGRRGLRSPVRGAEVSGGQVGTESGGVGITHAPLGGFGCGGFCFGFGLIGTSGLGGSGLRLGGGGGSGGAA